MLLILQVIVHGRICLKRYVIRGSKAIKIIPPIQQDQKEKKDEDIDAEDTYFIKYKAVNVFDILTND